MEELIKSAEELFKLHPTPWSIYDDELVGFVQDANKIWMFGGGNNEGRVDETDECIVALIRIINALGKFMKEEK
jgi:hypothetical protein